MWGIFILSIVNTILGLFIFTCGLLIALEHPFAWLALIRKQSNPGNSMWISGLFIGLFIILLILTILGCVWFIFFILDGKLETVAELATITSVVQGFVYGTVGIVIGLLSSRNSTSD